MGPVPQRTPVGHGARGLQRQRRRVVLLLPRRVAFARLPVGRGRPRRHLRHPSATVFRDRALERARPDPQRATLRAHEHRGQPRRGRQGVLLLPRQPPDALVPAVALQVPAPGVPVRGPGRHEPFAQPAGSGVRTDRHRHLRRQPLLRRRGRVRQGRPERHPVPHHRAQPRRRRRPAPRAPHPLVPQHLVGGDRRDDRERPDRSCRPWRRTIRWCRPTTTSSAGTTSTPSPGRSCCSARTRPTTPASAATPTSHRS